MNASIRLLRHQRPMLAAVASIILKAIKPSKKKIIECNPEVHVKNIEISKPIMKNYHKWLGVEKRYQDRIAPHLFPLWSYPHLLKLGKALHLPLHKVLNQGCKLVIENQLPANKPLSTHIHIYQVQNLEKKIRINQRITTGTNDFPNSITAEIYAVILKDPSQLLKKEKESKIIDTSRFEFINDVQIGKAEAQSYAYLSGDINPIHLSRRIAKRMGLKHSIMHGFGLFAILFEKLQKYGFTIKEIDIRFLSPVYLENSIQIFVRKLSETKYNVRVLDQDHKIVHLSGEFKI
ncbi:MAG: hypothetical protein HON90_18200 [Halobacteriovoraceae bacterium]|jgi:acyl dehydratase|nr:hypothetical protein [Halobacteriovoraceae bacterium]